MGFYRFIKYLLRRRGYQLFVISFIALMFIIILGIYNNVSAITFPSTDNINGYKLVLTKANIGNTYSPIMFVCEDYKIMFSDNSHIICSARYLNPNASGTIKIDVYRLNNGEWFFQKSLTGSTTLNSSIGFALGVDNAIEYANYDVYTVAYNSTIKEYYNVDSLYSYTTPPYIVNFTEDIADWSFDYLGINLGTINYTPNKDVLSINYNDNIFLVDLDLYEIENNVIYIPQQDLNNRIVFNEDSSINFEYDSFATVPFTAYNMGSYQITLNTDFVTELNDNAERNIQNDILNANQETNNQLQDLNDNLTSTDFDDNDISFPTINVEDGGVLNAMNSFFDKIYQGFTSGTLNDIVIPIPYTR